MIDTHCHLLASIDDGPVTMTDSIRMARKLAEHGVSHVVCTPHFSTRYPTDQRVAADALVRLEQALAELDIRLRLMLAAEVDPAMALEAPLEQLQRRAIGRRFVIVELLRETTPEEIQTAIERLASIDLLAVLAHPERCRAVQAWSGVLAEAKDRGGLLQVVAPSLTGDAPAEVGHTAWELVTNGDADIIASDGHRPDSSRLRLDVLSEVVSHRSGVSTARRLFVDGPRRLLDAAGIVTTD